MTNTNTSNEWVEIESMRVTRGGVYVGDYARIRCTASHGLVDVKGRTLGGMATITTCNDGHAEGVYCLEVMPTRAGKTFGASHRAARCHTIEQAKSLAATKLAAQRERYAGQAGNKAIGPATCAKNGHGPHVRAPLDAQCIHCQAKLVERDGNWHAE
jgi:hypothetical protein